METSFLLKRHTCRAIHLFCKTAVNKQAAEMVEAQNGVERWQTPLEEVLCKGILGFEIRHGDALRGAELEFVVREVELWDKHAANYLHRVWLAMAWAAEAQAAMVLIVLGSVEELVVHMFGDILLSRHARTQRRHSFELVSQPCEVP